MVDIHEVIGKMPFKPNWIHKITHYREMSHTTQSMLFLCAMISAIEITIHQLENVNVTVKY